RRQAHHVLHERGEHLIGPGWAAWPSSSEIAWAETPLHGVDVLPDDFLLRRHLEKRAVGAGADHGVAVREAMSARDEGGEEVRFLGSGIAPDRLLRSEGFSRFEVVVPLRVNGELDFVDGGITAVGPASAIVEYEHVPGTGESGADPGGVVLREEGLVGLG